MIAVESGESSASPSASGKVPRGAAAETLQAVVLCGGSSTRMGADKARLRLGSETLLARAVAVLRAVTPSVFLASGARDRYGELGLARVLDRAPGIGPLAGLEAALAKLAAEGGDLLCVLACDMPFARPALFEALLRRLEETGADACLLSDGAELEPLCGVYRASVLPAVRRALDRGERALRSFHGEIELALLEEAVLSRRPDGTVAPCSTNLNTPADLAAARRAEGRTGADVDGPR